MVHDYIFGPGPSIYYEVDPSYIHLGDNIFNLDYPTKIRGDVPKHTVPIGTKYYNTFDTYLIYSKHDVPVNAKPKNVRLILWANHVKPSSLVSAKLNNNSIGYINTNINKEVFKREEVSLYIPLDFLDDGLNIISIEVGKKSAVGEDDFEDIEIDHIGLEIEFEKDMSIMSIQKSFFLVFSVLSNIIVIVSSILYPELKGTKHWLPLVMVLIIFSFVNKILVF